MIPQRTQQREARERPPHHGNPAESYQRFFVPAIGAPVAQDLIAAASLRAGERILDVGCGTGVVARLAAEQVGASGSVVGLDIHPGMLAVAAAASPASVAIEWREGNAESLPFPERSFDAVLCQMSLQFVSGKLDALREMRRVLERDGRALVCAPGPKPALFDILAKGLARHFGPQPAAFADRVFSMHDIDEFTELMRSAGFTDVTVRAEPRALHLPAPADFLWQYISSTPLAGPIAEAGAAERDAFERDVCAQWQAFTEGDGSMRLQVGITTARGRK